MQEPRIDHDPVATDDPHQIADHPKKRMRGDQPSSRISYPRRRSVAACQLCRSRKTKCDNARPSCGSCVSVGVECNYQNEKVAFSSFDAATLAIIDRVDYVGSIVESQVEMLRQLCDKSCPMSPFDYRSNVAVTQGRAQRNDSLRYASTSDAARLSLADVEEADDATMTVESLELATICHGTTEDILEWPIFEGKYNRVELENLIFEPEPLGNGAASVPGKRSLQSSRDFHGVQEEDAPTLINIFLAQVHTKNPILDPKQIIKMAKEISEHGYHWEQQSCLVLLACGLACLASPFALSAMTTLGLSPETARATNSLSDTPNYSTAEKYYVAARKRIALLDHSVTTTQCHFLSGVYEMYSLRPVRAWTSFNRACMTLQLCLRPGSTLDPDKMNKSVLRRLFWSCLKSECELRMEIHVPSSGLAKINPSDVFPSPPSAIESPQPVTQQSYESATSPDPFAVDQEKSWYYYLADIAARRILNRLMNVFYKEDENAWLSMPVERMIRLATELEVQIEQWQSHLPAPVVLRQDGRTNQIDNFDELPYYLHGRVFEVRERLYRPFLYIAISTLYDSVLQSQIARFAKRSIEICIAYCTDRLRRHRHHGTWYQNRELFRVSLIILAAVKSRQVEVQGDWQSALHMAISDLGYWEEEAADIKKSREIIQDLLEEIDSYNSTGPSNVNRN